MDTLPYANEMLVRQLAAQGLNACLWQENLVTGIAEVWGRVKKAEVTPCGSQFMASLHVDLYTDRAKTCTISDNAAGFAPTDTGAIGAAADRFLQGTVRAFHALHDPTVTAADVPPMGLETISPQKNRVTRWKIYSGEWLTTGPCQLQLRAALIARPPLSLLRDEVLNRLVQNDDRLHWVKLALVCRADGAVFTECAINSEASTTGQAKLAAFSGWPSVGEMQSLRQFVLLQPQEQKERSPIVQSAQPSPPNQAAVMPSLRPIGG